MKYRAFGIFILAISAFFFFVIGNILFLMGIFYSIILIFHEKISTAFSKIKRPLFTYGLLVFLGGMMMELMAYISNIPKIQAGEQVFLFSTNLFLDLLIGFPHYIVLGITWALVLKRYKISLFQQALLIGLFWAIVVDNFSHLFSLISGDILDFIIPGLLMVFALNWQLIVLQNRIDEAYPKRNASWTRFFVIFLVQILPMIVLVISGIILKQIINTP